MTARRDHIRHGKILVVDDEPAERDGLARLVGQWGYEVETAGSGEEALNLVETQHPAVVVTDLVLPGDGRPHPARRSSRRPAGRPSCSSSPGTARWRRPWRRCATARFDYLTKPVDTTRLQVLLEKSIEQESLSREVNFLRHQLRQKGSFGQLVGQSKGMQEIYRWIELAATSTAPVLVYGESGTGKELVARTIHELSNRRNKPFVAINCAAIPETLIESELFGHERGAFTGATERRLGCFELADGGTLFLDEIAEMDTQHAGQAAARAAGRQLPARRRRQAGDPGRRARRRGHQPGADRGDRAEPAPRGPVLPAQRLLDRAARRCASGGGHPAARADVHRGVQPAGQPAGPRPHAGDREGARALSAGPATCASSAT